MSAESTVTNVFPSVPSSWTAREERALVEFILMTSRGDCWPTSVKEKFWEAAAKFVSQRCCVRQRTCTYNNIEVKVKLVTYTHTLCHTLRYSFTATVNFYRLSMQKPGDCYLAQQV